MESQKKKLLITSILFFVGMFFAHQIWIDKEKPMIQHVIFATVASSLYFLLGMYKIKYKKR